VNDSIQLMLFGTGKMLDSVEKVIKNYGYNITGYIDNNSEKWGTIINGKKIYSPQTLLERNDYIYISTIYYEEIYEQLTAMGIGERIISPNKLKVKSIENNCLYKHLYNDKIIYNQNKTIIFDSMFCLGWGGVEIWNYKISTAFSECGKKCIIYRDNNQPFISEDVEVLSKRFSVGNDDFKESVSEIIKDMINNLPIIVVNNWSEQVLFAAYTVKQFYPEQVQIISIAHFDKLDEYIKISDYRYFVDAILCVSTKIRDVLGTTYGIERKKMYYKESPILIDENFKRDFLLTNNPVKIAFACRLEIEQKRSDLLLILLDELEKNKVNYVMEIAGCGSMQVVLEDYVKNKGISNKVNFYGLIPSKQMADFWKKQDIYLNLSDFEGTSQAMLEAMSYGVVPVVTDVSGVRDFIIHGKNGYIVELEDIASVAVAIGKLVNNRQDLNEFGKICMRDVSLRCKMRDYLNKLEEIIKL